MCLGACHGYNLKYHPKCYMRAKTVYAVHTNNGTQCSEIQSFLALLHPINQAELWGAAPMNTKASNAQFLSEAPIRHQICNSWTITFSDFPSCCFNLRGRSHGFSQSVQKKFLMLIPIGSSQLGIVVQGCWLATVGNYFSNKQAHAIIYPGTPKSVDEVMKLCFCTGIHEAQSLLFLYNHGSITKVLLEWNQNKPRMSREPFSSFLRTL